MGEVRSAATPRGRRVTLRGQLILLCAGVIAVQLASAAAETSLSRRAARHHASSRAAHEQVEQLIQAEAELARQLKEVGDLSRSTDPASAAHDRRQIAAAQAEVIRAVGRYAELIADEIATPAHARGEAAAAHDLALQAAEVHAAVDQVAARGHSAEEERTARGGLNDRFDRAVKSLDQLIAGERAEMLEDDLLAAQASALASTMAWVAPLLCGAILVAGLGLVLRSISRVPADGPPAEGWAADGDPGPRALLAATPVASAGLGPDDGARPPGVLHDVGEALHLLAAAVHEVRNQLDGARIEPLVRAARALDEHRADLAGFLATPRGAQVLPSLVEATGRLADDLAASADDLIRFEEGIERVRVLVSARQRHARATSENEPLHMEA